MEREAALELLRSQHDFPGRFKFRFVVRPDCVDSVLSAISSGAGAAAVVQEVNQRLSRKGNCWHFTSTWTFRAPRLCWMSMGRFRVLMALTAL